MGELSLPGTADSPQSSDTRSRVAWLTVDSGFISENEKSSAAGSEPGLIGPRGLLSVISRSRTADDSRSPALPGVSPGSASRGEMTLLRPLATRSVSSSWTSDFRLAHASTWPPARANATIPVTWMRREKSSRGLVGRQWHQVTDNQACAVSGNIRQAGKLAELLCESTDFLVSPVADSLRKPGQAVAEHRQGSWSNAGSARRQIRWLNP